ncbi:tigger transposable element-derived protein 2-like [Bactrocera tryoni]|uniref:tigger transposable element-derived protein 2-like n=1 Tax=Bactrocera tryoni TaxID=59916 RepID=UPI001A97CEF8|nr:tigger transposable element-derived protein 2-like [Bactrocera tryoni]
MKDFQTENNLDGKAILLVDNAFCRASVAQLTSDDGKIITIFLPPNYTALIQPMDQNAIRLTKLYYRKSLLVHILSVEENDDSKAIKNLTIKDAVFLLANSWDKLSSDTVAKCWQKILPYSGNNDIVNTENNSDADEHPDDSIFLSVLKEKWTSQSEDAQELIEIGALLQRMDNNNHQLPQSEISEWLIGDNDHLPHSDDDSSVEEVENNY